MPVDMNIVQGDLLPAVQAQLLDGDGNPIDLTGCTVECRIKTGDASASEFTSTADILDATHGIVQHGWIAGETDAATLLLLQFVRVDGSGKRQTFPASRPLQISVDESL